MLSNLAPTSQRYKPISFVLDDQASGAAPVWVPLVIRPEDLTKAEPSRVAMHQTLGIDGAGWIDSFGPGLPTITISGHTGWRRPQLTSSWMTPFELLKDGAERFEDLHREVFENFHKYRQGAVDSGRDPNLVKLIFVDDLDGIVFEVVPMSFTLRRSKSRPLLMQYNIQLQVVSRNPEVPFSVSMLLANIQNAIDTFLKTINSLSGVASSISSTIETVADIPGEIVSDFIDVSTNIFDATKNLIATAPNSVPAIANDLIAVARDTAAAGKNAFQAIAATPDIPIEAKAEIIEVSSQYRTAFCLLGNALKENTKGYQDYSDLYGASNCSSTTGGRPASSLSDINPFEEMKPPSSPVNLTVSALAGLTSLSAMDPVLSPMQISEITRNLQAFSGGFSGVAIWVGDLS